MKPGDLADVLSGCTTHLIYGCGFAGFPENFDASTHDSFSFARIERDALVWRVRRVNGCYR